MTTKDFTAGDTAPQDFQLKHLNLSGDWEALDGSGLSVELDLVAADGTVADTSTNVAWFDAPNGIVRYLPDAGDLVAAKSPYAARFKVTDGSSRVASFPDGRPDRWVVRT